MLTNLEDKKVKSLSVEEAQDNSAGLWLQQQLCRKLVRQIGGTVKSYNDASEMQIEFPVSTQNQVCGMIGGAINKFTFIVRKGGILGSDVALGSHESRSRSSLVYGSISSSGDHMNRIYRTQSSNNSKSKYTFS